MLPLPASVIYISQQTAVQQTVDCARQVQCSAPGCSIRRSGHAAVRIAYNSNECHCDVTAISRLVTFSLYFA